MKGRAAPAVLTLLAAILAIWTMLAAPAAAQTPAANGPVIALDLDGAVGPATREYIAQGLEEAAERDAALVVIRMDTPGGLDSSTRDIISDMLDSPVPVAVFVTPAGARAASAGTYILYASHLAAMTPGAHLGAATPVQMGGSNPLAPDPEPGEGEEEKAASQDAMTAKVTNDAAAYIRSLAGLQDRNAEWAEAAVRRAETLTAREALDQNVIELLARDMDDLVTQADGRAVMLDGEPFTLRTAGAEVVEIAPDWRARLLAIITNPNIAYLLLMVGVYGLIFEFMSPGAVGPGVVGAVCLVVGLFALNMLPVNYAGAALLLLGIGLLTAEALVPGVGVFGLGGVVALAIGSILLFRDAPGFRLSPWVIFLTIALSVGFFLIALRAAVRAARRKVVTGAASLIGAAGKVKSWSAGRGFVHAQGESWQARSEAALIPGQAVRVTGRDGLTLIVEPDPSA
ncbi:MAG: nodulation protein NfeD [Phenylobacterium sp.]|uniref:NfeD family protein n=1 Tax=Phenylobacterium sp. TaxID=1871053 RepID=UPI00179702F1|nr:nodulation protein NfeD [Phenylobacterium sp.]MBA4793729.1 nodulation protein NfeD [Phenylobacterium sp.]